MGRSQETFSKKEKEKKKLLKRKEKQEKREERKANSKKGKSFEEMIAYVDENGNLSSTPPDPNKKVELKLEDIQLGARKNDIIDTATSERKGRVSYYNESKMYGFIKDASTKESIFFHVNAVKTPVREGDIVTFEVEKGPKGLNATAVTKA